MSGNHRKALQPAVASRSPKIEGNGRRVLEVLVDVLIEILDQSSEEADQEDDGNAEPSLGSLDGAINQVMWASGGDDDRELAPTPYPRRGRHARGGSQKVFRRRDR